jgi:hypothetical protein
MTLATKWLDYKTGKKRKKKRLVDGTSITFVAQLVLGSNPKVPSLFKVNLLVPMNLSICWAFIDFGKEWVSEWGTYFE